MIETASPPSSGRRQNGTFAPGHKFAKGNPNAAKVQKLREGLLEAVSADDLMDVVKVLIVKAKTGDVAAAKLLFDRLLGPPLAVDVEERMQTLEQLLERTKG